MCVGAKPCCSGRERWASMPESAHLRAPCTLCSRRACPGRARMQSARMRRARAAGITVGSQMQGSDTLRSSQRRVVDVGLSSRVRVRGPGSIMACHVHVRRGVARLAARCLSTLRGRACVGAWVDEWKLLLVWQYVARHGGRWSSKTPNSTMFEETRI